MSCIFVPFKFSLYFRLCSILKIFVFVLFVFILLVILFRYLSLLWWVVGPCSLEGLNSDPIQSKIGPTRQQPLGPIWRGPPLGLFPTRLVHGPLQSLAAHLQAACWLKQLPTFPAASHLLSPSSHVVWLPMDGFLPRVTAPPSSLASVRASSHATPLCSRPGLVQSCTLSHANVTAVPAVLPSPASYHLYFSCMFVPHATLAAKHVSCSTTPTQRAVSVTSGLTCKG